MPTASHSFLPSRNSAPVFSFRSTNAHVIYPHSVRLFPRSITPFTTCRFGARGKSDLRCGLSKVLTGRTGDLLCIDPAVINIPRNVHSISSLIPRSLPRMQSSGPSETLFPSSPFAPRTVHVVCHCIVDRLSRSNDSSTACRSGAREEYGILR
jgi:hypothetical protein